MPFMDRRECIERQESGLKERGNGTLTQDRRQESNPGRCAYVVSGAVVGGASGVVVGGATARRPQINICVVSPSILTFG